MNANLTVTLDPVELKVLEAYRAAVAERANVIVLFDETDNPLYNAFVLRPDVPGFANLTVPTADAPCISAG